MIFELLFLVLVLVSVMVLIAALAMFMVRKRAAAGRTLLTLAVVWGVYLCVVLVVAIVAAQRPQRVLALGQDRCFDEMCFAVQDVKTAPAIGTVKANGLFYMVTIQAVSHSRGRAQREGGLHALAWDSGKYYGPSPEGQRAWEAENGATPPLDARLNPGESIRSVQVFDVPQSAHTPGLVLSHGFTPGYFVIGECPLFRKPAIVRLTPM